jgi:hypothetical protein
MSEATVKNIWSHLTRHCLEQLAPSISELKFTIGRAFLRRNDRCANLQKQTGCKKEKRRHRSSFSRHAALVHESAKQQ